MKNQLDKMSMYCSKEVKVIFSDIAKAEKRTISALLAIAVEEYVNNYNKRRGQNN